MKLRGQFVLNHADLGKNDEALLEVAKQKISEDIIAQIGDNFDKDIEKENANVNVHYPHGRYILDVDIEAI